MSKRGFTLIELLVVIGIMGLLGSVAAGGYRAMVRGMEERGVVQNADSFVRAAYQRAQIDRQPTIVYFWNERVQSETEDQYAQFVGKAVAVRRSGRITQVNGQLLVDEFADWRTDSTDDEDDDGSGGAGGRRSDGSSMAIYAMDLGQNGFARSFVYSDAEANGDNKPVYLDGGVGLDGDGKIPSYGYRLDSNSGKGGANIDWKPGMSYGFEFQRLELPLGYIFGTSKPPDGNAESYVGRMVFDAVKNTNGGLNKGGILEGGQTEVGALRQNGADFKVESIGTIRNPDQDE